MTAATPIAPSPGSRAGPRTIDSALLRADRLAARLAHAVLGRAGGAAVAVAESVTLGRIASSLAAAEGASLALRGGIVAYHESTKRRILGVTAESVYCEQAALEMARGARRLFDAEFAVATTGVAGPDPIEGQPAGTVFIATACGATTEAARVQFAAAPPPIVIELAHVVALRRLLRAMSRA